MKFKTMILMITLIGLTAFTGCNSKEKSKSSEKESKSTKNEKFDISKAGKQYQKAIEEGVFYEEISTTQEGIIVSQVWIKGENLKRITPAQNTAMIINNNKIVSYDTSTKQGYLMQDGEDGEDFADDEDDSEAANYYNDIDQETIDAMTEEVYDGQDCMVTEMTMEGSGLKLWINKKTGFFVKFEMLTEGSLISSVEYKNVKFGKIKDSEFDIPADVVISDMSSMMDGNLDLLFEGLGEGMGEGLF